MEDNFEWQVGFHFCWFEFGCADVLKIQRLMAWPELANEFIYVTRSLSNE